MSSSSWMKIPLLRNERLLHVAMAMLLAIFVVGSYSMRFAFTQLVERIVSDTDECLSISGLDSELQDSLVDAQKRHERLEHEYSTMLARIPKRIVDSEVLTNLRGLALASRCSLFDFRPTITLDEKEFHARTFDLHLEGGFQSLFQFFESLKRFPYMYQVTRCKISEPSNPSAGCRIDLELKVVFDHIWSHSKLAVK